MFKKGFGLILIITMVAALSLPVMAEDAPSKNSISVTGSASVKVQPDTAIARLGVKTDAATASAAQQANNEIMEKVLGAIKAQGINETDIQTSGFYLSPNYKYNYDTDESILVGYQVENSVNVTIRDISKVSDIMDAGIDAGANVGSSVQFSVEDPKPYYQQCLQKALTDAKSKASALATALGVSIGNPAHVSEGSNNYVNPVYRAYSSVSKEMAVADLAAGISTPISPGEIEISAEISAVFEY